MHKQERLHSCNGVSKSSGILRNSSRPLGHVKSRVRRRKLYMLSSLTDLVHGSSRSPPEYLSHNGSRAHGQPWYAPCYTQTAYALTFLADRGLGSSRNPSTNNRSIPTGLNSTYSRPTMSSQAYRVTRPGPSNSLMSENAAERRNQITREQIFARQEPSSESRGRAATRPPNVTSSAFEAWFEDVDDTDRPLRNPSRGPPIVRDTNESSSWAGRPSREESPEEDNSFSAWYARLRRRYPSPEPRVRLDSNRGSDIGNRRVVPDLDLSLIEDDYWLDPADRPTTRQNAWSSLSPRRSIPPIRTNSPPLSATRERMSRMPGGDMPTSARPSSPHTHLFNGIGYSSSLEADRRRRAPRIAALRNLRSIRPSELDRSFDQTRSSLSNTDEEQRRRDPIHRDVHERIGSQPSTASPVLYNLPPLALPPPPRAELPTPPLRPLMPASSTTSRDIGTRRHINLDAFHDGPFRASLERSVEIDRRRRSDQQLPPLDSLGLTSARSSAVSVFDQD